MIELDDARWTGLLGGYRIPYDPRNALRAFAEGRADEAWAELWNELHHQGDVGEASYAAIPHLVRIYISGGVIDWNIYAFVATIEGARRIPRNPSVPAWLRESYDSALSHLVSVGFEQIKHAREETLVSSIFAVLALRKEQPFLGRIALLTETEREEMLRIAGFG